jgi:uncharacterized membrane protein YgcG
MISVLLLPLLLNGNPSRFDAIAEHDDPPIQLWINNDRRFLPGERGKVQVRTEEDGYLLVLHVDPDGYLRVLFPLDPDKDNFVRGGKKYEVKGRGGREAFETDSKGRGTVYAAVSREPFRFEGFVAGDHWDYRALAPSRFSDNPESELNELVRRMAQGNFDYDLLNYDVVERAAYASDYAPRYYGSVYDDPWCYSFCGRPYYGSPFSISITLGRPYRRYYYDPYFYAYDPFYNPFFYDPYYYAPAYYPRYVYPRHYYYPYRDRLYYDHYRYGQPYTPYRFRDGNGFAGEYRNRRNDIRSVNTVYNPPITGVREPAIATPARRVIEGPAADLPDGPAQRRLIDNANRVQGRPEAKRARPADPAEDRSAGEPRLVRREVEARPSREAAGGRDGGRAAPGPDRARDNPRTIERPQDPPRSQRAPATESSPPRREVDRGSSGPPSRGGGGGSEGRSSGGSGREGGGSRPEGGGGRRPR